MTSVSTPLASPSNTLSNKQSTSGVETKQKVSLSAKELRQIRAAEKIFQEGMTSVKDLIAPPAIEKNFHYYKIGDTYCKTFYVYAYPRFIEANWLSPVINLDVTLDVSMFIIPSDSNQVMKMLRTKVAQMQSTMNMDKQRGVGRDPALEASLEDAEELRDSLARGNEKFFQYGLYFTVYADDVEKIKKTKTTIESLLGGKLVLTKPADLQHDHGFTTTLPICTDDLEVYRSMNTSPLSSSFPFTSSDLTSDEGILYGINRHNNSLIIFDRFSLENANSVIFAKSGAGKSFAVKLEVLRSMMLGTDVIVIDPENEYDKLSEVVGGTTIRMSLNSSHRINPFDLPSPIKDEETKPGDLLRSNIISLVGLFKLMLGGLNPTEEGLIDRALIDTYAMRGITLELEDPSQIEPPTMEDFEAVLSRMQGSQSLIERLSKYTKGSYSGIFNQQTNLDFDTRMLVFQVRDLEDELRPIAIYVILNFIWNRVRSSLKKRLLIIDEAWSMMQYDDSARFIFGLVKRARKYYLGVSTITQDVEDFLHSPYGKAIITNSSMQLLLKQSPSAADALAQVFHLTEGEKYLLLNSQVGQGIFFAGMEHVALQIIASYTEEKIITTDPEALLASQSLESDF